MTQTSPSTAQLDHLYSALKVAVRAAGGIALQYYGRDVRSWDKSHNNPVSEADMAVDNFLKRELGQLDPHIGWLSEESEDDHIRLTRRLVWIVDPIDGTRAFLQGQPDFTISAALVDNGQPILAALLNPVHNELFSARKGHGALLNGRPLQVSAQTDIQHCRIFAHEGLFKSPRWTAPWPPMHISMVNSIAYRIALVAAGRLDAVISLRPKSDWDLAAADLILREAGGVMTDCDNQPHRYNQHPPLMKNMIAAPPALQEKLRAFIQQHDSRQDQ